MYSIPAAPRVRRPSRLWHLFWLLVIGLLGSGAMLLTATMTSPRCYPSCPPDLLRPLSAGTGEFITLGVVPVLTWLIAFGYGRRWAGLRMNLMRGGRLLVGPFLTVLLISWWIHNLPGREPWHDRGARLLVTYLPPMMGILLLGHLDILLRVPRSAAGGEEP